MRRFLGVDDDPRHALLLVEEDVNRGESGEAREARIKRQYEETMDRFAKGDVKGAKRGLLGVIEELEPPKKNRKDWERQLVYLARRNLAEIEEAHGFRAKALEHFFAAVREDDTNVVVWLRAGRCAADLGRLNVARRAFEGGLLAHPGHWLCKEELEKVLSALGEGAKIQGSASLLRKRKAAELKELDSGVVEGEEIILVEVDCPTWGALVGSLLRALRQRLKQSKTCAVIAQLAIKGQEKSAIGSSPPGGGETNRTSGPTGKKSEGTALLLSGTTGAAGRSQTSSRASQKSTDGDVERPRKSQRREKLDKLKEEGRRRNSQQQEEENVDIEGTLLKLLPLRTGSGKESTEKGAEMVTPPDSDRVNASEKEVVANEQREKREVLDFSASIQGNGDALKKNGILDLFWKVIVAIAELGDGRQYDELRRAWKSYRSHYLRMIPPQHIAITLAEAFMPVHFASSENGLPREALDAESLKRLFDAEALLYSLPTLPLGMLLGKTVKEEELSSAARISWAHGEALLLRGKAKKAVHWFERCEALLEALQVSEEDRGDSQSRGTIYLFGGKEALPYRQQREVVIKRLRLLDGANFLEEAKAMLESGNTAELIPKLRPVVRAAAEEGNFDVPQLVSKIKILRMCCEKVGDDASALACRSLEVKIAVREARKRAAKDANGRIDSSSLFGALKKANAKLKDTMSFDGGEDAVNKLMVGGWTLIEAVRMSAEALAAVAAIVSEDIRSKHRGAASRSTNAANALHSSEKQKKLGLARAMLGYSRAFWFIIRWVNISTHSPQSTSGPSASVQLLCAVRFALHQLALCHAVRADGTSGAVIKFYASVLRERLADLAAGRAAQDESDEDGGESENDDKSDVDDPSIWNHSAFCRQELAQCYSVLYNIPVIGSGENNWLTKSCGGSQDTGGGSTAGKEVARESKGFTDDPQGDKEASVGNANVGGATMMSLDVEACGHILEFYRAVLLKAVRADRDKNMKRVMELLAELSSALEGNIMLEKESKVKLQDIETAFTNGWSGIDHGEEALDQLLSFEFQERALQKNVSGESTAGTTLYEVKMLRAAAILRVTENEFKRRKEPERRCDIEEVLDSLLEASQELKEALRVRPWSVSAWRLLGCVQRDVGNTALDVETVLGKGRSTVEDPAMPIREAIACFHIAALLMHGFHSKIAHPLRSGKDTVVANFASKVDHGAQVIDCDQDAVVMTDFERRLFLCSSYYDAFASLYILAREERARGEGRVKHLHMRALECANKAASLTVPAFEESTVGLEGVDYENCSFLKQLSWYHQYLAGKIQMKVAADELDALMGLKFFETAAQRQKESESLRAKKGSTNAPEVEGLYRLRASQLKLLLRIKDEEGRKVEKVLAQVEQQLGMSLKDKGEGGQDVAKRVANIVKAIILQLDRCRSKENQEYGEYFYKSVYHVALATWKLLGDHSKALERVSVLFRPDVGERGYFYLMWNYRFTDLCRSAYLETERKHRQWRSKCLRLYVELLSACGDYNRLWSVFLRGRRRSKDDAFETDIMLLVIRAYAAAALTQEPDSPQAVARIKRAWDAMEETTRILHERQGAVIGREPTFIALKSLMEFCYLQLDLREEDADAQLAPVAMFKAAVKFCSRRWGTDPRIAKRALAALAGIEEEQTPGEVRPLQPKLQGSANAPETFVEGRQVPQNSKIPIEEQTQQQNRIATDVPPQQTRQTPTPLSKDQSM